MLNTTQPLPLETLASSIDREYLIKSVLGIEIENNVNNEEQSETDYHAHLLGDEKPNSFSCYNPSVLWYGFHVCDDLICCNPSFVLLLFM